MLASRQVTHPRASVESAFIEYLCAHRLFGVVPRVELQNIASELVEREYLKGHRFYCAGDQPTYVFIIKSGLVALTDQDDRGHVYATMTYSPGDVLGVAATVLELPHAITPVAMVDTTAILINGAIFKDLYRRFPAVGHKVVCELYHILRRAETATVSYARISVPGRVAALLLNAVGDRAALADGELTVDIKFSHQELAILLGTTRETITRVFARLVRAGIIAIRGKHVCLLQPAWLRRIADNNDPHWDAQSNCGSSAEKS